MFASGPDPGIFAFLFFAALVCGMLVSSGCNGANNLLFKRFKKRGSKFLNLTNSLTFAFQKKTVYQCDAWFFG